MHCFPNKKKQQKNVKEGSNLFLKDNDQTISFLADLELGHEIKCDLCEIRGIEIRCYEKKNR